MRIFKAVKGTWAQIPACRASWSRRGALLRSLCHSHPSPVDPVVPHKALSLSERWTLTKERFKAKKVQFMVEFGSTFLFLHEMLGITSYLVVFSLIHFNVINVDTILGVFGWNEAYLMERFGINAHGLFTKWALTIATVKGLDAIGLIPLRWALTIFLTPRVAFFLGPKLDALVAFVKSKLNRKS